MFEKQIVVDCRGHLLGRLASILAKEALNGQHIVCVRCEELNISGSLFRNKLRYASFLRKRTLSNPKKGPIHFRAPSRILWRTVRGMLPHKTARGEMALQRLKYFDGVPAPFDKQKRMVIPSALRMMHLRPGRPFTVLGNLSEENGWKHRGLIKRLEEKRKARSTAWFDKKKKA